MILNFHNWRCFDSNKLKFKPESTVIVDANGSGKTSYLSGLYSLFTKESWPLTKFSSQLKQDKTYFGLSFDLLPWSLTAKIAPSGRLQTKYQKPDTPEEILGILFWPKILTYIPEDNLWLTQSRTNKLEILDRLLTEVFGVEFIKYTKNLKKNLSAKQKYLKKIKDEEIHPDQIYLTFLNQNIQKLSLLVWAKRQEFLEYIQTNLTKFSSWINSPVKNWQIRWETTNHLGDRQKIELEKINFANLEVDWKIINQKEIMTVKNLFGAHRDDFDFVSGHKSATEIFSRGEMRLFVLFIKLLALEFIKQKNSKQPIWWFLDDIFNEFDADREKIFLNNFLNKSDFYLATSTKVPSFRPKVVDLRELTV